MPRMTTEQRGYFERMVSQSIALEVKQWAVNMSIPWDNFQAHVMPDYINDSLLAAVSAFVGAQQDHKSMRTSVKREVPATLMDWVRWYVNKALPSWMEPLRVNLLPALTEVTELWRVCPHMATKGRDDLRSHLKFVTCGGDFDNESEECRIAAQAIVRAALHDTATDQRFYPSMDMMHAVQMYNRARRV